LNTKTGCDPISSAIAITTRQVLHEGYPVLFVSHDSDSDGDWQVLCGTTTDEKDALLICLGEAVQHDRPIAGLADMPRGWLHGDVHRAIPGHVNREAWSRTTNSRPVAVVHDSLLRVKGARILRSATAGPTAGRSVDSTYEGPAHACITATRACSK
jgi:hypothetical protein